MERTKRTKMITKSFKISEYDWNLLVDTAKKTNQSTANLIRSAILEKIFRIMEENNGIRSRNVC